MNFYLMRDFFLKPLHHTHRGRESSTKWFSSEHWTFAIVWPFVLHPPISVFFWLLLSIHTCVRRALRKRNMYQFVYKECIRTVTNLMIFLFLRSWVLLFLCYTSIIFKCHTWTPIRIIFEEKKLRMIQVIHFQVDFSFIFTSRAWIAWICLLSISFVCIVSRDATTIKNARREKRKSLWWNIIRV